MRPILKLLIGVLAAAWRSLTNQGHHRRGETGRHDGIPPVTAPARKSIPHSVSGPMRSDGCGGRSKSCWTVTINVIPGHLRVILDDGAMRCDIRPLVAVKLAELLTEPGRTELYTFDSRQGQFLCRWYDDGKVRTMHITRWGMGVGSAQMFGHAARLTEISADNLAKVYTYLWSRTMNEARAGVADGPPGGPCLRRQRRPR